MKPGTFIALLLTVTAVLSSCGNGRTSAYPKPEAYPRISDPGENYIPAYDFPVTMEINAEAIVSQPRGDWADIVYPNLGTTVHVSFTPTTADDIEEVIDNRIERISLNIGDRSDIENISIESGDFTSSLIISPESRSTPLQFVSVAGDSTMVVSGTAFLANVSQDASIDSLSPIVRMVERDLRHTLSTLSKR